MVKQIRFSSMNYECRVIYDEFCQIRQSYMEGGWLKIDCKADSQLVAFEQHLRVSLRHGDVKIEESNQED